MKHLQRGIMGFDLRLVNAPEILNNNDSHTMVPTLDPYTWSVAFPESWESYQPA